MAARRKRTTTQAQRRNRSRGGVPGWVWMLGGFLPGLFLAALVHLHHERQQQISAADVAARPPTTPAEPGSSGDEQSPRFEFYKLLSEMEVVVPDDEPLEESTTARIEAPGIPPGPDSSGTTPPEATHDSARYMVQAGSFRNHGDADRLKARLALMGVEAEIQSVRIDGGETWHRVRIGPINSRSRVDEVRRRLEAEQVESILLRLQG